MNHQRRYFVTFWSLYLQTSNEHFTSKHTHYDDHWILARPKSCPVPTFKKKSLTFLCVRHIFFFYFLHILTPFMYNSYTSMFRLI